MVSVQLLVSASATFISLMQSAVATNECQDAASGGAAYSGTISVTVSGRTCQQWSLTSPHSHGYTHLPANYCRNPDGERGVWCYTTEPALRWEHCEVPHCTTRSSTSPGCQSKSTAYSGTTSVTVSGRTCQQWSLTSPHSHGYTNLPANYCRNPDGEEGAWCYTTDPGVRWQFCDVPQCGPANGQIDSGGGCPWDDGAMMFQQREEAAEPVKDWTFTVTEVTTVPNTLGWPTYRWMPDGHISVLYDNSTMDWLVFYPNHETYRSRGRSPLPEEQEELEPSREVLGGRLQQDAYNNGGEWLDAVHRTSDRVGALTGFLHVEDQFWDGNKFPGFKAFKSIALACSSDLGRTWERRGRILTSGSKPSSPAWSGIGDFDVVWDWQQGRWFLLASHLRLLVSSDRGGGGDWRGWDGARYTANSSSWVGLKDSSGEEMPDGEHPAIHWNRLLQQWVLVWNGYDGRIYITSSSLLADRAFSPPRVLVDKERAEEKNWYPNLISSSLGDRVGEGELHLYWRHRPRGLGKPSTFRKAMVSIQRG